MVKDAIRGYLESLMKHGEEIPVEPGSRQPGARRGDPLTNGPSARMHARGGHPVTGARGLFS